MKHRCLTRHICTVLLLLMCPLLAACGKIKLPALATPAPVVETAAHFTAGDVPFTASELTIKLKSGETALLDSLTSLRAADFSGSENEEEVAAWAKAHPNVQTRYTVTLPDGTVLDSDETLADLSAMSAADCEAAARKLALLPGITGVKLGAEGGALKWSDIARLREILPKPVFKYAFKLYGTDCDLSNTTINLFRVPVGDNGVFIDEVMGYMPQLTYVDMDSCGVDPKRLEEINLKHPDAKLVFRVYFGDNYTARTDTERILASMASRGGMLENHNVEGLYYCHDVKYIDIGHNTLLTDIGFLAQMPKLEVAILSMCNIADLTPLMSCPELEYLELSNTYASDLRPLSGLKKLRHLNVAAIGYDQPWGESPRIQLTDITPLYSLTELERLWIGAYNPVPAEQVEEMQRRAPNCEINLTVYEDPVGGRWRYLAVADYIYTYVDTYHERYAKLREQFGNYEYTAYNFTWNDPLLDPNYDPATAPKPTTTPTPTYTPAPTPAYVPPQYEDEYTDEYNEYTITYDPYLQNQPAAETETQTGGTETQSGETETGGISLEELNQTVNANAESSVDEGAQTNGNTGAETDGSAGENPGGDPGIVEFVTDGGGAAFPEQGGAEAIQNADAAENGGAA